ncbi:hypothetical protein [Arthrobacter sp. RCC_34]|uniref:hypothetical protein n=1 Tax=Arthrobacter sp. RCC_34 TaxID=3239230 RepID=UPI00352574D3
MTTPAPGFPPELEAAVTEALAEHGPTGLAGGSGYSFDAKTHMCRCDRRWISESEYAVHLAAVVMETIAQHTTTEWGVSWADKTDEPSGRCASSDDAADLAQAMRNVAPAVVVSRLVLPWQEVKA